MHTIHQTKCYSYSNGNVFLLGNRQRRAIQLLLAKLSNYNKISHFTGAILERIPSFPGSNQSALQCSLLDQTLFVPVVFIHLLEQLTLIIYRVNYPALNPAPIHLTAHGHHLTGYFSQLEGNVAVGKAGGTYSVTNHP